VLRQRPGRQQTPVLPAVTRTVTARVFLNLFNEVVSTLLFRYGHKVMYNELETVKAIVSMCSAVSGIFWGVCVLRILWVPVFVFLITMTIDIK
jgi:hypothetical protein